MARRLGFGWTWDALALGDWAAVPWYFCWEAGGMEHWDSHMRTDSCSAPALPVLA